MKNELYKLSAVDLLNMYKNRETNPLEEIGRAHV